VHCHSYAAFVRTAQQTSGILVLPVLLLLFGPAVGFSLQGLATALTVAAAIALVAGGLLVLAVRTFERETVLTRWR
jgi:hypothetical protein